MLKQLFTFFGVIILMSKISAQQDPQYSNFLFNAFAINPANAGLKECLDARIGYRTQWVGFESAPKTAFVTAHQRLNTNSRNRRNAIIHGVGGVIEADNQGPLGRTYFHAAYALHLPVGRNVKWSFALSGGFVQYRMDVTKFNSSNPSDPLIANGSSDWVFPDIAFGTWLYGKGWFTGLSVKHLTNPQLEGFGEETVLPPHFNLMAGKVFGSTEGLSYVPAVQLKFMGNSKAALDVNFWIDYQNRFAIGGGFRNDDAVMGMFKFNFLNYFTLAYAYDFSISRIAIGSANTHELTIGIVTCPRKEKLGFVPCSAYD